VLLARPHHIRGGCGDEREEVAVEALAVVTVASEDAERGGGHLDGDGATVASAGGERRHGTTPGQRLIRTNPPMKGVTVQETGVLRSGR
jgi:hypothetical protein